jgi:phenylacetate-coenzyme A ligase PaaK-like adenylate-forming protein
MSITRKRIKDAILRFLPLSMQFGRDFKKIYLFLMKSRTWDRQRIIDFKIEKFKTLLCHAERNVPYYKKLFAEHGIRVASIKGLNDFNRIPILTKKLIKDNFELLKANGFEKYNPIKTETSGTTGRITVLYRSSYLEAFRKAILWRIYHENGLKFNDKKVYLTTSWDYNPDSTLYEHDKLQNALNINMYHITAGHCDEVVDSIRKFRPALLWTHPNILAVVAHYIVNNDLEPLCIPVIGTFGEKIYPHISRILRKAFRGNFIDYYANRENSIAAFAKMDMPFKEVSEYCHMEINQNSLFNGQEDTGDLICTSLHNYAMPLIRYNSEDIVKWTGYEQSDDKYPSLELVGGRGKDLLLTRDGLMAPYLPHHFEFEQTNHLKKYQLEQVSLDEVIIRIVPLPGFDKKRDEPLFLKYFDQVMAGKFRYSFEYADDIPFTKSGKYPMAVSRLATEYQHIDALE